MRDLKRTAYSGTGCRPLTCKCLRMQQGASRAEEAVDYQLIGALMQEHGRQCLCMATDSSRLPAVLWLTVTVNEHSCELTCILLNLSCELALVIEACP